jgi:hypothetical protein
VNAGLVEFVRSGRQPGTDAFLSAMGQKVGRRQGRYYIVSDAFESETGDYWPLFSIFDGEPLDEKLIKRQDLPASGPSYRTAEQAIESGFALAREWLSVNRVE